MLDRSRFAPFWRLAFLFVLALLSPPHASPHVRAPETAPRPPGWTVDPSRSQATIGPHWAPFAPCSRPRSVQRCASSRGRTARPAPRRAAARAPSPITCYAALEPHARRAWFFAAIGALERWALHIARAHADPDDNPHDIAQTALLAALADWEAFAPDPADAPFAAVRRWLAGILEKKRLMARRFRLTRREVSLGSAAEVDPEALRHPGHAGEVEARSVLRALRASTTPERWRVWLAFEGEGMTARQVAAQEGRPATTITWLILLARKDFARVLARLEKEGAS